MMKLGAVEHLVKPFTQEELREAVERVLNALGTRAEQPPAAEEDRASFHGILGRSEPMQEVYRIIERTQNNRATVLVTGESGTGKEMVARAIHYNSAFAAAPLSPWCGAIPDQLLESELFGPNVKGRSPVPSRTGSASSRRRTVARCSWTRSAMLPLVQAKASFEPSRTKEVTMLGATKPQRVEVQPISAANNDLPAMIGQGTFREDLYYRLNLIDIHLPPLRERVLDIPLLVDRFNHKFSKELGKKPCAFRPVSWRPFPAIHGLATYAARALGAPAGDLEGWYREHGRPARAYEDAGTAERCTEHHGEPCRN